MKRFDRRADGTIALRSFESADDESFERELFALRAQSLPRPLLDVREVFARADERTKSSRDRLRSARWGRAAAWLGAAACAAATYGAAFRNSDPGSSRAIAPIFAELPDDAEEAVGSDGMSCRIDLGSSSPKECRAPAPEPLASYVVRIPPAPIADGAMCGGREPTRLMCEYDVTFASTGP